MNDKLKLEVYKLFIGNYLAIAEENNVNEDVAVPGLIADLVKLGLSEADAVDMVLELGQSEVE